MKISVNDNGKKAMIQDMYVFSSSYHFAQIVYFIRGFLNAHIVGPSAYGLWAALGIMYDFAFLPLMGILNGMAREIPYAAGKGDEEAVGKIRSNAFGFTLASSAAFSILIACAAFFFRKSLGAAGVIGMVTIAMMVVVQNAATFYEMALAAVKKFSIVAAVSVIFPIFSVALTFMAVPRWNIYGIYAVAFLTPLAILLFYYFRARYRPVFRLDLKETFRLIRTGFPLMALALLPILLFTVDRMFILRFLGMTALGYYAFALLISRALIYLPGTLSMVLEPRLFHRYGETGNVKDLERYVFVPTEIMSVFLPLLIAVVYLVSSFVIRHLLVQYSDSLRLLFIVLFGKFFMLFSPMIKGFFTAINQQRRMLFFYAAAMFLSAALDFLVLKSGHGLIGVALVTALVSFLLGTSLFVYAMSFYLPRWSSRVLTCVKAYFPCAYIMAVTLALDIFIKDNHGLFHDLAFLLLKISALISLSIVFVLYLEKELGFTREIARLLKSSWSGFFPGRPVTDVQD
ncbi:MAG: oligosaccharide flippase family protein [Candidatus Omnitrophota bacterium]